MSLADKSTDRADKFLNGISGTLGLTKYNNNYQIENFPAVVLMSTGFTQAEADSESVKLYDTYLFAVIDKVSNHSSYKDTKADIEDKFRSILNDTTCNFRLDSAVFEDSYIENEEVAILSGIIDIYN